MTVAELVAKLGIKIDRESWGKAESGIERLKHGAEALVGAFGIHEIKEKLDQMIEGVVENAHETEILSENLGITTDKVQELAYAARSVGQAGLSMSLRQLANHAQEATTKGGESAALFHKLGVRLTDVNGKLLPADRLLENVADGMQKVTNPTERMAMASHLFGRNGVQMIKVLKDGSAGMREMYERAHKLGVVMSTEMIAASKKEHEAQLDVNSATQALQNSIVEKLLPAKTWLLEKTQAIVQWFTGLAQNTNIVKEAMAVLSAVVGVLAVKSFVALLQMIGATTLLWLAFGVLMFLIIDDIIATLQGGDSLGKHFVDWAGEVYDKFMAWSSINPVIEGLMAPIKALVGLLKLSIDAFNALIMAATGDFSGFKIIGDNLKKQLTEFWEGTKIKVGADLGAAGAWFAGGQGALAGSSGGQIAALGRDKGVIPSVGAVTRGGGTNVSTGPLTVNQKIIAAPGQDVGAVGDAAAASFQSAHESQYEQAYNKLIPTLR